MSPSVDSPLVDNLSVHRPSTSALRLDVAPFVILYAAAVNLLLSPGSFFDLSLLPEDDPATTEEHDADNNSTGDPGDPDFSWLRYQDIPGIVALVLVVCSHALVLLSCYWSVRVKTLVRFRKASSLAEATHVHVTPAQHCGSPALCELHVQQAQSEVSSLFWFEFQKVKFATRAGSDAFHVLNFPVDFPLGDYLLTNGLVQASEVKQAVDTYGRNEFDIPLPNLADLFQEHALSPFFLFQVLCVALWCLDEYWYYSVFTLVMLVVFELTVCKQRIRDLETLRAMRRPPYPIWVFRQRKWQRILTDELLPGDVCSVVKVATPDRAGGSYPGGGAEETKYLVPCDILLLYGSCIVNEAMLTGESVPKTKDPLTTALFEDFDNAVSDPLQIVEGKGVEVRHARHVIMGGTQVIQHKLESYPHDLVDKVSKSTLANGKGAQRIPNPPDGGCVGYVLRTGYYTNQGSLMRTILFSTERVTVDNAETYLFILILLVFAVLAAGYVLMKGLEDESRSRWKLVLHCIMIVTSVVPPELPMELSLAVTTSLGRLHQLRIFCTEPYRIPFAGKVDVCCFDKTGTLTSDNLIVQGVAMLDAPGSSDLVAATKAPKQSRYVLAACHQLVNVGGKVQGDAMEKASLKAVRWTVHPNGKIGPRPRRKSPAAAAAGVLSPTSTESLRKVMVHSFSSSLRRMSCVVDEGSTSDDYLVLCKGAPEKVVDFLATVPSDYVSSYNSLMRSGYRVLALAHKTLPKASFSDEAIKTMSRHDVESNLEFAGLLVLDCPLKQDTLDSIQQLQASKHKIVVITGDNPLTACNVAKQLNIVTDDQDKLLLLQQASVSPDSVAATSNGALDATMYWKRLSSFADQNGDVGDAGVVRFDWKKVNELASDGHDLVVTGDLMSAVENALPSRAQFTSWMQSVCPSVRVFARVAPRHKELVLAALKATGSVCLMCGDGTNDVGALKQAEVGVSIINNPDMERAMKHARSRVDKLTVEKAKNLSTVQRLQMELRAMEEAERGSTMAELGDASIASPFTSQTPTIKSVVHIVRQGRCTLVTTIQMFKILALNCLISAYTLSSLYLNGVKQGDTQMTLAGLLIAGLFMCISWASPLEKLSADRPVSRVFSVQVGASLIGQFVVHMASLLYVLQISEPFVERDAEEMAPDADFKPNVINTAVFLITLCMQVNVFACNYRGHPYMQSLMDNKALSRVLALTWGLDLMLALDAVPGLGELFELVEFPSTDYQYAIVGSILANTVLSWGWEMGVRRLLKG